jgi:hypothetical protein
MMHCCDRPPANIDIPNIVDERITGLLKLKRRAAAQSWGVTSQRQRGMEQAGM